MRKIFTFTLFAMMLIGVLSSCGKKVDPISLTDSHQKIAISPFSTEDEVTNMSRRFSLDLGTQLDLVAKDREWIYDQSDILNPISSVLEAQGLSAQHIFDDSALAAQIGREIGADVIFVGHIANPRIKDWIDNNFAYDMSNQAGISGTTKFVLVYQQATIKIHVKAIDTKSGNVIWDNHGFVGYTKYVREFQSQDPAKEFIRVSEDQIRADLRKHMLSQIGNQLYPLKITARPIPDILMKPDRELKRAGGKIVIR